MKTLLFVGNDANYFLSHRLPLAQQAIYEGYLVHVAMPEPQSHEAAILLKKLGFHYHTIALQRMGINPFHEIRAVWNLYRLYQGIQPDLIHHIAVKAILYGGIAALISGKVLSVNAFAGLGTLFTHEDVLTRVLRCMITPVYRLIFLSSRVWAICQNPDDLKLLSRSGITHKQRSVLIRSSGINLREFAYAPEPEGVPVVMLASRMLKTKGVYEFIQAAAHIKSRGIAVRFVLVGDSPVNHAAVPADEILKWQQQGVIEWWGHQSEMFEVLRKANIVCLPSHYREGVPKVLLEAAACGRAIVTSNIPGCREIVIDGDNGLLVEPINIESLANGIIPLLTDKGRRKAMGLAGRKLVTEHFSVEKVVRETLDVYQKLLT